MPKWYEEQGNESDVVISSRIRLARNFVKYPFSPKLSSEQAELLCEELHNRIDDNKAALEEVMGKYYYYSVSKANDIEKQALVERHIISNKLARKNQHAGVIMTEDESVSLMLNEDDHIRIQVIQNGLNLLPALEKANAIDDIISEFMQYAYDDKLGYLTSSPTNVGTGLRASVMVYLPALGSSDKLEKIIEEVNKYGVSIRGMYGEGNKSVAYIYQVSNMKTLGMSEVDTLENLTTIVEQIIKQERKRREYLLDTNFDKYEDQVYRSYGVLRYAKQITTADAMTLLAQIKFGFDSKIITSKEKTSFYKIMMAIQPANLQKILGKNAGTKEREKARAAFLNKNLPELV
ncbi:protein arginine kinase [Anaerosporobacter faecicola]|uniref:protein arginine kinase n=1 Tax=Anaerosporobacter faecicola TaxID=2718714 RepID=UPI00143ABF89|nr:protein arginine kinase [Anaerosporobacter faecicola]